MKKIINIAVPLWMVIVIVFDSAMAVGIIEYYLLKRQVNQNLAELAKTTQSPEELVQILRSEVLPQSGYKTSVVWKDIGKQLIESGVIDKKKYEQLFSGAESIDEMKYLDGNWDHKMVINERNSRFMVNTLWALGLINKTKVLDEGSMKTGQTPTKNFASTAGWTLGEKNAMIYYSSKEIIPLTSEQQNLVKKIAENVYRPCCGNSTAFPDCNHGMAALGFIAIAVSQGVSEQQIYKDLLALNSFWFGQNYVEMAAYFNQQGIKWKDVDPKLALSQQYSSAQGMNRIRQSIQALPGFQTQGGGCSA